MSNEGNLREPLLSSGQENDGCNKEEHPRHDPNSNGNGGDQDDHYYSFDNIGVVDDGVWYPPWYLQAAAKNVGLCLVIRLISFVTRSIWHYSIMSIFVVQIWRDRPEYVGFVAATAGIFQTVSSRVAPWSTHQTWFHNLTLVRSAALTGTVATAVSLWAMGIGWKSEHTYSFGWFLVANGMWGLAWGLHEEGLPKLLIESACSASQIDPPPPVMDHLTDRYHVVMRMGCFLGTLYVLLEFWWQHNEWTEDGCARILAVGAATNLGGVLLLFMLRSMEMDWDEEQDEASTCSSFGLRDCLATTEGQCEEHEPLTDSLLPPDNEIIDENHDAATRRGNTRTNDDDDNDGNERLLLSSSTMEEIEPIVQDNNPDDVLVLRLLCLNDALSSLAGGLSAWYLPVFLVQSTGLSPVGLQCLCCLLVPLGQWVSPVLAEFIEGSIGPCFTCLALQGSYVVFFVGMLVFQKRAVYSVWMVWLLYALHGSLTNSTSGPIRRLAKKHIPEGKESVLDFGMTLQKVMWSFGCLVGGALVRQWGLSACLGSTAALQFLACLSLAVLWILRGPHVETKPRQAQDGNGVDDAIESPPDDNNETVDGGSDPQVVATSTKKAHDHSRVPNSEADAPLTPETEAVLDNDDDSSMTKMDVAPASIYLV